MADANITVKVDVFNLEPTKKLYAALCQIIALLEAHSPELAQEAHGILRQALPAEVHPTVTRAATSVDVAAVVARGVPPTGGSPSCLG